MPACAVPSWRLDKRLCELVSTRRCSCYASFYFMCVSMQVSNIGNADAGPFTAGLYLSRQVNATSLQCNLDPAYPLRESIQLATVSYPSGLRQGETQAVVFPRGNTIESWQASQFASGRASLFRCLFVLVNDAQTVYELQPDWTDNLAIAPVRLLDLVDLQVPAYQVSLSSFPWISARVFNGGIKTAPPFYVDFYQVC
jgi:hypothetical protein